MTRQVDPLPAEETYPNLASIAHRSEPVRLPGDFVNPAIVEQCRDVLVEVNRLRREVEILERRADQTRKLIDELSSWRSAHLRIQAISERDRRELRAAIDAERSRW